MQTIKIWQCFCNWSQFLRPNIDLIFLKTVFSLEYWIRRATFVTDIWNFIYFQKIVPNKNGFFNGPQSNTVIRYQKVLWGCIFGCKYLFNFFSHTMKLHNCHHTITESIPLPLMKIDLKFIMFDSYFFKKREISTL